MKALERRVKPGPRLSDSDVRVLEGGDPDRPSVDPKDFWRKSDKAESTSWFISSVSIEITRQIDNSYNIGDST